MNAEVRNPFDGSLVAEFHLCEDAELTRAMDAAQAAFEGPVRAQTPEQRSAILSRVADGIRRRERQFTDLIVAEAGKPVTLAEAEVARAEQTFRFASEAALSFSRAGTLAIDASPAGKGYTGSVRRFPLGVILAITPFNFPLNLVAHKVAPAMAAGNAVFLKPSPRTPLCSLLLGEALQEAGAPAGQVRVVPCENAQALALLKEPRVKMLSFTGSAAVGWDLKACSGKAKATLELGGNAAAIVHRDADWRASIPLLANGAFGYAGQSCISVQRVFVQREIYREFRSAFLDFVRREIKCGDPRDRAVTVGPLIDLAARDRVLAWVNDAMKAGAKLLTDLHPSAAERVLPPIVLEDVPAEAEVAKEEVFGPVAVLAPYDDFDEAIALVNASRYGLQAGVFTRNAELAERAYEKLDVGAVLINQAPTFRVENMPYGGVKDSGFGREGVQYAMEEMSEPRALVIKEN